jgi:hypothetical protein
MLLIAMILLVLVVTIFLCIPVSSLTRKRKRT